MFEGVFCPQKGKNYRFKTLSSGKPVRLCPGFLSGKKVADIRDRLKRQETELAEFHCVLVRTKFFEQIGKLDEGMLNTKEHLDFCMEVARSGGKIYFEPDCIVTYVPGLPLEIGDLTYYMLRWSDAWVLDSLQRLR